MKIQNKKTVSAGEKALNLIEKVRKQFLEKNGFPITEKDALELISMRVEQNNLFPDVY